MLEGQIVMDPNQKFALSKDVLMQRFEEDALLVDLERERVYQLNNTGAHVAELISAGCSFEALLEQLEKTYTASLDELEAHVGGLIDELLAKGLVVLE